MGKAMVPHKEAAEPPFRFEEEDASCNLVCPEAI
jgi:hypothetical protein